MRKCVLLCGLAALAIGAAGPVLAGTIDEGLQEILESTPADQTLSTLAFLRVQVDIGGLNAYLDSERASLALRHEVVVTSLQQTAAATQDELWDHLEQLQTAGRVESFEVFWIANCFRVDATPAEIKQLAQHPDIGTIYFNYEIRSIEPVDVQPGAAPGSRTPEPGVAAIRAPEAWAIGYTGQGTLVSTLDTGVAGNHPALASRWAGLDPNYAGHPEWAFFDPVTNWTFPQDAGSHGTHTMGTVCGGPPGDEIGVAPGAQWIHAAVIDRVSIMQTCTDAILAFQWLIDPDGDPQTNWDVPDVCSNSWGLGTWHTSGDPFNIPCNENFWSYLDACEAAGIVILFSAGNEGPDPDSLRRPSDRATDDFRTCAVAAVDGNNPSWPIASFSSRGPTTCTPSGSPAIKPDISAPGVSVRSASPSGGYANMSGTSMASPHVNGVVALMREACPDLTPQEIKEIIYETAVDLGTAGEDNSYGWGMVDAFEAVNMALAWCISSEGEIDLDAERYMCEDEVTIIVRDLDLNTDPGVMETVEVTIESDSEPAGELVVLTETGPDTARFEGVISLSETNAPGVLLVAHDDTVTATYIDEDNGMGGFNIVLTATATVDCVGPVISNVEVIDIQPRTATIELATDEPARAIVHYGPNCGYLPHTAVGGGYSTTPTVTLTGLETNTTYYFMAEAEDVAGNLGVEGNCYSFDTPDVPDFFTELFVSGNDLQSLSLIFTPDSSISAYAGCVEEITSLPTDPTGGTSLPLSDDDYEAVTIGNAVSLYGVNYNTFYVGSNGYITFGGGDTDWTESLVDHFDMPRISGVFDDLNPSSGGTVSWKQLADRVAVTWQGVPEYSNTGANTFQIELFFDGTITLSYLTLSLSDGLAGLSEGNGLDPDFFMADLSEMGDCGLLGDLNCDGVLNAFDIDPFVLALTDPAGYAAAWPNCDIMLADCNGDGVVNAFDIDPFVALLVP